MPFHNFDLNILAIQMFEAAFEVGVKSGKDGSAEAGRSKAVASSATANYAGSGGPGVAVDFDALYAYVYVVNSRIDL